MKMFNRMRSEIRRFFADLRELGRDIETSALPIPDTCGLENKLKALRIQAGRIIKHVKDIKTRIELLGGAAEECEEEALQHIEACQEDPARYAIMEKRSIYEEIEILEAELEELEILREDLDTFAEILEMEISDRRRRSNVSEARLVLLRARMDFLTRRRNACNGRDPLDFVGKRIDSLENAVGIEEEIADLEEEIWTGSD